MERSRLTNLQALRGVALFLVVASHLAMYEDAAFPNEHAILGVFEGFGHIGVDIFFVISGFILMATSWKFIGQPGAVSAHVIRRVLRIYPSYWIALLALLVISLTVGGHVMRERVAQSGLVASFLLLPQAADHTPLLSVSWTLVFETCCYATFALLIAFDRRYALPFLCTWLVVEIACVATWESSGNAYLAFAGKPFPIEFIAGAFTGWLFANGVTRFSRYAVVLGLAIAALTWWLVLRVDILSWDVERVAIFGIPAVLLVYGFTALERARGAGAPVWISWIGDRSYSLYLWHIPVIYVLTGVLKTAHLHGGAAHAILVALFFCAIGLVGSAAYAFVEKPMRAVSQRALRATLPRFRPAGVPAPAGAND